MKKIVVCLILLITMCGCSSKPDGICPYTIMVGGQMYYTYDEIVEVSDVEELGYITSYVNITQLPKENNQSNFPDSLNQPYGMLEDRMLIYYSGNWHKCYLPEEIDYIEKTAK